MTDQLYQWCLKVTDDSISFMCYNGYQEHQEQNKCCIYGRVAYALPFHKTASVTESNIIIHSITFFGSIILGLILSGRYAHYLENRTKNIASQVDE
ncbi:hypothetical protein JXQ70_18175 [bacterium]|nr:hypothetical protein [bacterium]